MLLKVFFTCVISLFLASDITFAEELVCVSDYGTIHLPNAQVCPEGYESWSKLLKDAENGDVNTQYRVGVMYTKGIGGTKSYSEAEKWLRKAAQQGHPAAQNALSVFQNSDRPPTLSNQLASQQAHVKSSDFSINVPSTITGTEFTNFYIIKTDGLSEKCERLYLSNRDVVCRDGGSKISILPQSLKSVIISQEDEEYELTVKTAIDYSKISELLNKLSKEKEAKLAVKAGVMVGADISSLLGPVPLVEVLKRLVSLKDMSLSWQQNVNMQVPVNVSIRAEEDFFDAIRNLLRPVGYKFAVRGNTVIVCK